MPDPYAKYQQPAQAAAAEDPYAKYQAPATAPPDSFFGGAGRRVASMVPPPHSSPLDYALDVLPGVRPALGIVQAARQAGAQLPQQMKEAVEERKFQEDAALKRGEIGAPLAQARAATTALSVLDPFATGSVANVNQLSDEGRYKEAAGQGLTDAGILAAGELVPRIAPSVGRVMETNAPKVAEFAAHPIANTVRPIVRGAVRSTGKVLQGKAPFGGPSLNAAPAAAANPLEAPIIRGGGAAAEPAPAPYRLSGNQITQPTTVTPRRVLGPERQLPPHIETPAAEPPATITPLKATTPAAAQTEVLRKMGVASPKATIKPMESIPAGEQSPAPFMNFATTKSGSSAALDQLTHTSINGLRTMAIQRGLKVSPSASSEQLIRSIHNSLTPEEIDAFEQARVERMQPSGVASRAEIEARAGKKGGPVTKQMAPPSSGSIPSPAGHTLGTPEPVQGVEGASDYPILKNGERVGKARIVVNGNEAEVGLVAPEGYKAGGEKLDIGSEDFRKLKAQFEKDNPGVKLKLSPGSATGERAAARIERRATAKGTPEVATPENTEELLKRSISRVPKKGK